MNKYRIVLVCVLLLCFFSCKNNDTANNKLSKEYQQKYHEAFVYNDKENIESTIDYIDSLILSDNKDIKSLYYNKAQLLFKLGNYDDALAVMIEDPEKTNAFYTSTLLIKLGGDYENIGLSIVNDLIKKNEYILFNGKYDDMPQLVEYIFMLYKLSDNDIDDFSKKLFEANIIKQEEIERIVKKVSYSREEFLDSMWPK